MIPYSEKFSLGANFRHFHGQTTCIRENSLVPREGGVWARDYRENRNSTKMEIDDVILCVSQYHRCSIIYGQYELVPVWVCLPSKWSL